MIRKLRSKIDELKKDRYQALPDGTLELLPRTDIDEIKVQVAREIFEEIEKSLNLSKCYSESGIYFEHDIEADISELKKKYTGGCTTCAHIVSCEPNPFGTCKEYEERHDE